MNPDLLPLYLRRLTWTSPALYRWSSHYKGMLDLRPAPGELSIGERIFLLCELELRVYIPSVFHLVMYKNPQLPDPKDVLADDYWKHSTYDVQDALGGFYKLRDMNVREFYRVREDEAWTAPGYRSNGQSVNLYDLVWEYLALDYLHLNTIWDLMPKKPEKKDFWWQIPPEEVEGDPWPFITVPLETEESP